MKVKASYQLSPSLFKQPEGRHLTGKEYVYFE